jgi:N-acylneuraminate cytidylyltransferase
MRVISLILARGGSKGIPKKNIKPILGHPLVYYSINSSLNSNVDEVWVSSDCDEILDISRSYGANGLKRPDNLSTDLCKSDLALLHFSDTIDFDILVFLQPTSPLLNYKDINAGLEMMNNFDSVFTAYKKHWIPEWSLDKQPINWDITNRPMRQQKDSTYVENGAMYITTKNCLKKSTLRSSGDIGILEMPFLRSFQIDTMEDFFLIEKIMQSKKNH